MLLSAKRQYMNYILILKAVLLLTACENLENKNKSTELISDMQIQDSIFKNLVSLTNTHIPESELSDSLAFLILPVEASCPACRKKTIDSILKHQTKLIERHYIIISAPGGRKIINSYFQEQGEKLPVMENKLFLDSIQMAFKYDLFTDNPTIYYTANKKAYKKVSAVPATVKDDLREFFSGFRGTKQESTGE